MKYYFILRNWSTVSVLLSQNFAKVGNEIWRNKMKISRNTQVIFGANFREISYPPYIHAVLSVSLTDIVDR
jgi:hypothetical protein